MKVKNTIGLILMLVGVLVATIGCTCGPVGSPIFGLIIENQTSQTLTVYVDSRGNASGIAQPRKAITTEINGNSGRYLITAKNAQGEIVFSETYTFMPDDKYHLELIDGRVREGVASVYKAVIPSFRD